MLTLGIRRLAFQPVAAKTAWSRALLTKVLGEVEAWRLGYWAEAAPESAALQTLLAEMGIVPGATLTGSWGPELLAQAEHEGLLVLITGWRWAHGPAAPVTPESAAQRLRLVHPLLPWFDRDLERYLATSDRSRSPAFEEAAVLARLQELGYI